MGPNKIALKRAEIINQQRLVKQLRVSFDTSFNSVASIKNRLDNAEDVLDIYKDELKELENKE